ncbi:uncharacterized protein L3040_001005 [Drepanopeziza brunnea f. sp. 'multigermtubi']|uniref:uncharacterized protein n=1 Tax=Drepanopeziza brunnea f. sp. 'multigermtubi' TaxID=698441 RepID=UPI00239D591A|nr:hypothetical protein L3040_001005 [Drepanopeziza brunnea f. sp. 'multigermtubi']
MAELSPTHSPTAPLSITTDPSTSEAISRISTQPVKAHGKIKTATHIPLHKYQLTHNLLYERHFFGESYISAHLTRLQNGVFVSPNIHADANWDQQDERLSKTFVTFVAIAFTFHPSLSEEHRFNSAVIEITAKNGAGEPLRVLRFAPHMVYGRISSASLRWNFQGPAKATVDPKIGYEKDLVVGSFMRIQGSTRSTSILISLSPDAGMCFETDRWDSTQKCAPPSLQSSPRIPDTALVWSLEENSQQEGGVPREFTFVFLLERPLPRSSKSKSRLGSLSQSERDAETIPRLKSQTAMKEGERSLQCCTPRPALAGYERVAGIDEQISRPPAPPRSPPPTKKLVKRSVDMAHALAAKAQCIHTRVKELEDELAHLYNKVEAQVEANMGGAEPLRVTGELLNARKLSAASTVAPGRVFTPIRFQISIKPRIANAPDKSTNLVASEFDESIVEGQVGQRFGAFEEEEEEEGGESVLVGGLYNFAAMGGHFEDLVELPGSSVGTMEPSLPVR